jgi:hypothetical protein
MIEIRDVWADNLLEEMENIRQIVDDYPFVSMVRDAMHSNYYLYIFCDIWRVRADRLAAAYDSAAFLLLLLSLLPVSLVFLMFIYYHLPLSLFRTQSFPV